MNIYYQFLSSRDAITDMERKMIKVSRILNLNDLFELRPYLRIDKEKKKRLENIRKKASDVYGMICFSNNWNEPLLWGHYADRNKGVALGFEFISKKYNILPVNYPNQRERDPFGDMENISIFDYIRKLGYTKYSNWSYENEYRFFVKIEECLNIEGNYFFEFKNHLILKEVLIGPEHPYKNKIKYLNNAKYFIELVKSFDANLIVTRPEYQGYKIVKCGRWTPRFVNLIKGNLKDKN